MKSKVVEIEYCKKERKFPIIAKSVVSGTIVLFSSETIGVVLWQGSAQRVGYVSQQWASVFDSDSWQILNSVTITFES